MVLICTAIAMILVQDWLTAQGVSFLLRLGVVTLLIVAAMWVDRIAWRLGDGAKETRKNRGSDQAKS